MFTVKKLLECGIHYQGSLALADTSQLICVSIDTYNTHRDTNLAALQTLRQRVFKTIKAN